MDLVTFALDVIEKAGPVGCLVLFAWLWMSGRIVSRGEFDRAIGQLRDERDHARGEAKEWKVIGLRGTELARYFGEKATAP